MANSRPKILDSRILFVLLLIAVAFAWSEFAIRVFLPVFQAPHWPTSSYWVAPRLALEGNADLIYPDRAVFFQQAERLGTVPDIFEPNMPTTILLFLPLAVFSETTAYAIWSVAMLLCYILACALLVRALALPTAIALALWALVPLFHPWRENITRGQSYALIFLLLVIGAILGFARSDTTRNSVLGNHTPAGFAFGLIAVLKLYYAAVFLLPALLYRRWRILLGAAAIFAVAVAITFALWGPALWLSPIGYDITWRERPETAVTAYQTLTGLLTHMLRYDATWNLGPVANLPQLAGWLWWAGAAVIFTATCVTLWLARGNYDLQITNSDSVDRPPSKVARSLLPIALMVPVALVLAPIAEEHTFILTLFPLLVAGKALWDIYLDPRQSDPQSAEPALSLPKGSSAPPKSDNPQLLAAAALLALSALLLAPPWHFNVPSVGGWHSLLYYPRLYGALLLWLLIMVLMIATRPTAQRSTEY